VRDLHARRIALIAIAILDLDLPVTAAVFPAIKGEFRDEHFDSRTKLPASIVGIAHLGANGGTG
jgi:hypothetical protein